MGHHSAVEIVLQVFLPMNLPGLGVEPSQLSPGSQGEQLAVIESGRGPGAVGITDFPFGIGGLDFPNQGTVGFVQGPANFVFLPIAHAEDFAVGDRGS